MEADKESAYIAIEISHPDPAIQKRLFDQFKLLRGMLEAETGETWEWSERETTYTGKVISRIYKKQDGLNIFQEEKWPAIISFLKPRIMALDAFWLNAKDILEMNA